MRKRSKHGGAIKLMSSAFKFDLKSTHQLCVACGENFRANPTQLKVWGGKCYECFINVLKIKD